ncbi:MAG: hypothetical protein HRT88_10670, partial [Lentisphaeraceae bacterium]|nr:hypothetical protein [Lentisphaeraceae bacterium]
DILFDMVEDDSFKSKVGVEVARNKVELKVPMGSLNKVKTFDEIKSWCTSKKIDLSTEVCITLKFDGLSLLVEFENGKYKGAATRGDGSIGQDVSEHFRYTTLGKLQLPADFTGHLVGETIMREQTFADKYTKKFKNPRNMVAGLLSRKQISQELEDVNFIAFSAKGKDFATKSEELEFCNTYVNRHYHYRLSIVTCSLDKIKNVWLKELFDAEKDYQCDGLVLEVDEKSLQVQLGRETNSLNPAYARAWKPESDDSRVSTVLGIQWQVSKNGSQKPVVQIEPVDLAGVTISNVTGINANFIEENAIAPGAAVSIIRSGDVIPKIINVVLPIAGDVLPKECSCCAGELHWNDNHIDLVCANRDCRDRKISENTEFFKVLGVDEVGEGIVKQFYDAGHVDIKSILKLSAEDMQKLEGFQSKKALKVYESILGKLNDVPLFKIQHASNLFKGLGSRKLEPVSQYDSRDKKPSLEELISIDGYSEISARSYLSAIDEFWDFLAELPITLSTYEAPKEGVYTGKTFVFTGFRSPECEAKIVSLGGKMGSSVSKKSYALVMKKKGSGSSKEKKALAAGVIVMDREELEKELSAY